MIYGLIENGVVVNAAIFEQEPDGDWVALPEGVGVGFTYDGTTFAAPVLTPEQEAAQAEAIALVEQAARTSPQSLVPLLETLSSLVVTPVLDTLTSEQLAAVAPMYPIWKIGVAYPVDKVVSYERNLYRVVQAHTSQAGWEPPQVPAIFTPYTPAGVIAPWVQPTGAQDVYALGTRVTHNGDTWESTVDNNSWEPGVFGWVVV